MDSRPGFNSASTPTGVASTPTAVIAIYSVVMPALVAGIHALAVK